MLRNSVLIIILSFIITMLLHEFEVVVRFISFATGEFHKVTAIIFSSSNVAIVAAKVALLILIPALVGIIIGGLYFLLTKKKMPYLTQLVWIAWIIMATALAANYQQSY